MSIAPQVWSGKGRETYKEKVHHPLRAVAGKRWKMKWTLVPGLMLAGGMGVNWESRVPYIFSGYENYCVAIFEV